MTFRPRRTSPDVLDAEPLPAEGRLRGRDNVIITSRLAGQTVEARVRAGLCAAADVLVVLDGRGPRHPVNCPSPRTERIS